MSTSSKYARDNSRQPLTEYSEDAHNIHPTPAGTKRLFSNRASRLSLSDGYSENHNIDISEEEAHSGKRHRASDWPLSNGNPPIPQANSPLQSCNATASLTQHRPSSSQIRLSKFVEGSMNDRVSQIPPTTYIGDEELRERYEREENARGRKMAHPKNLSRYSNPSMASSSTDRPDISRHSSIFRFGKSLAATFNPSNWKIWTKQQQEDDEETVQQRTLRERQLKAQQIYQELKKTGQFRDSAAPPNFVMPENKNTPMTHDTGSAIRASSDAIQNDKRMGRVYLEPPQFDSHGESPLSNVAESVATSNASGRKNAFQFRRRSLSSIRKPAGSDSGSNAQGSDDQRQPRRIPSRKDLQKQQKLVKRVSDLEGKLDAARRQLAQSLGEPVPPIMPPLERIGRPRFVPGALSTLPSERLLSGYASPDDDIGMSDNETCNHIGRAVTTNHGKEDVAMTGSAIGTYELEGDAPALSPVRKNKPLPKPPHLSSHDPAIKNLDHGSATDAQLTTKRTMHQVEIAAHSADNSNESSGLTSASSPESEVDQESDDNFNPTETSEVHIKGESDGELEAEDDFDPAEVTDPETESEYGAKRKATRKPMKKSTKQSTSPLSKKRKSPFDRDGDNSGHYQPPPQSEPSTVFSEVKKAKPASKKGASTSRPRKLQKTVQDSVTTCKSSPRKEFTSTLANKGSPPAQNQRIPVTRHRSTSKKASVPTAHSSILRSSSKLSKSKSASSPPSSMFGHLDYPKAGKKNDTEPMYSAIPSVEGDVPPMPKLPKAVRLPSGEVVNTAPNHAILFAQNSGASGAETGGGVGKLTKTRRAAKEEKGGLIVGERKEAAMNREDSFEWDKDVF